MTAIELRITRASAIAGKVVDEQGEPVEGALVAALRYRNTGGGPQLSASRSAPTDDLGNYRLFGLEPGRYYLRVTRSTTVTAASVQDGTRRSSFMCRSTTRAPWMKPRHHGSSWSPGAN